MIQSKEEYLCYLNADRCSLGQARERLKLFGDLKNEIWKFEILLRKCEYYKNCKKGVLNKLIYLYFRLRFQQLSYKLRFEIPLNVCGLGLCIVHGGTIIINGRAKIGANCRIHSGVNIGTIEGFSNDAPIIGDNVYIGPRAKIFGPIKIGNDCRIGANSVVNKNFEESRITIAGIPAKKVSDKGSDGMLLKGTEFLIKDLK